MDKVGRRRLKPPPPPLFLFRAGESFLALFFLNMDRRSSSQLRARKMSSIAKPLSNIECESYL